MYIENSCSECSYFSLSNDVCMNKHAFNVQVDNSKLIEFIDSRELKNVLLEDGIFDSVERHIMDSVEHYHGRLSSSEEEDLLHDISSTLDDLIDDVCTKLINFLKDIERTGGIIIRDPYGFNCSEFR